MNRFFGLLLAMVAVCSVFMPASAQLLPGTSAGRNLTYDGRLRSYRVFAPANVSANAGVLIALHGGGLGSAQQVERSTGFSTLATQYGFVAVYPQGVLNTWNAGDCCGNAKTQNVDDVGFIAAVLADVRTRNRVNGPAYVTGMSNGGMMAYRMACERPQLFAGFAPVGSTLSLHSCNPPGPLALLHIHGLQDRYVPYDGGNPTEGFNRDLPRLPVPGVIGRWMLTNGCFGAHPDLAASQRPGQRETAGSSCNKPVHLVTLQDAGHTWPGDEGAGAGAVVDPAYTDYDASMRIVDFFGLSQ